MEDSFLNGGTLKQNNTKKQINYNIESFLYGYTIMIQSNKTLQQNL